MRAAIEAARDLFKDRLTIGAEVGVNIGNHAVDILEHYPEVTLLYLIDEYFWWPHHKKIAEGRLKSYGDRVRRIVKRSELAAETIDDGSLDFCYIDANHMYEAVKTDIKAWLPKVRAGGILGGHDYYSGGSVEQAVTDIVGEHNNKNGDWWIIK